MRIFINFLAAAGVLALGFNCAWFFKNQLDKRRAMKRRERDRVRRYSNSVTELDEA